MIKVKFRQIYLLPGMLLAFVSGSALEWRGQVWVGAVLAAPLLAMVLTLTETPVFLLKQGKINLATKMIIVYCIIR